MPGRFSAVNFPLLSRGSLARRPTTSAFDEAPPHAAMSLMAHPSGSLAVVLAAACCCLAAGASNRGTALRAANSSTPRLLFGPTANLLLPGHGGVARAEIARQVTSLVRDAPGLASWQEVRGDVEASRGALHLRNQAFSFLSAQQQATLARGNRGGLQVSIEAGGEMCGPGRGAQAAVGVLSNIEAYLAAGGTLSFVALESIFSRTHAGCPAQDHAATAAEAAAFAAALGRKLGPSTAFFLYDALPHYSVGSWPANVPQ